MRKFRLIFIMFVISILFIACASQQLTKDQEARVLLNSIQTNLETLFDTGSAYVKANPQYQAQWKSKIVPSFDLANKTVKSAIDLAKEGKYTRAEVEAKVTPLINQVIAYLGQIGAIK